MRPLDLEERAEILTRNPGATNDQLENFERLLHQRVELSQPVELDELSEAKRRTALREVEAAIDDLERTVFPRYEEACAAIAARRIEVDEGPIVV